jgi:hypothetical protein
MEKLQYKFVRLFHRCVENRLKINDDKCTQIYFTRRKSSIILSYSIYDKELKVVFRSSIKD